MNSTLAHVFQGSGTTKHWSEFYADKSWLLGGRGPDGFDCWGVIWHFYGHMYDIVLPPCTENAVQTYQHNVKMLQGLLHDYVDKHHHWIEIQEPFDGCGVLMAKNGVYTHIGVYAKPQGSAGFVVHALPPIGTARGGIYMQPVHVIVRQGFSSVKYYRHKNFQS